MSRESPGHLLCVLVAMGVQALLKTGKLAHLKIPSCRQITEWKWLDTLKIYIHATERGREAEVPRRYMSYPTTHSLSTCISQRKGKNNPGHSLKGPHQRHVNNIKISPRRLVDNSSLPLCLRHSKRGPEKGRDTTAECVQYQGRFQSYLYNVTYTHSKTQVRLCE